MSTSMRLVRRVAVAAAIACFGSGAQCAVPQSGHGIQWVPASSDAEVDKAFALARQQGKPVFLYWGAVWCPPCNQVKATLFSRPDFIERTRAFVPVYVDGDKPGAQKVASRFHVAGYPTMVLFKPDGTEVTRLPGEVDPERYLLTLGAGLETQVPVKQLVQRALGSQPLTPQQWRLLAYYSWDTDQQQLVKSDELAATLTRLAAAVPADQPRVRERLAFKAIVARAKDEKTADRSRLDSDRVLVEQLLGDAAAAKEAADLVLYYVDPVLKYVAPSADARSQLATRWDAAIAGVIASNSLSRTERVDSLDARIDLWKLIDRGDTLAPSRQAAAAKEIRTIVAETTDRYERQSVIPSAAHVLTRAGLLDESDALLKAELPRAVAPYYHMLGLASNAKERGDKAGALRWYELAWQKSEGPATRLQWGSTYVKEVVALSPHDVKRVLAAASGVVSGLEPKSETFFERNERSLQRMAQQLAAWQGSDAARQKAVAAVRAQLSKTCARMPAGDAGRTNCEKVFTVGIRDS